MDPNKMNLISGHLLDPTQVTPEDIYLIDIARPLSYLCRGVGQCKFFFSVGQHSIHCAKEAEALGYSERVQLACLLHDGGEAYMNDIIRPVKQHISGFRSLERQFQRAILTRFGIGDVTEEEWNKVREIDNAMLTNEMKALFAGVDDLIPDPLVSTPAIAPRPFEEVEQEFSEMVCSLSSAVASPENNV